MNFLKKNKAKNTKSVQIDLFVSNGRRLQLCQENYSKTTRETVRICFYQFRALGKSPFLPQVKDHRIFSPVDAFLYLRQTDRILDELWPQKYHMRWIEWRMIFHHQFEVISDRLRSSGLGMCISEIESEVRIPDVSVDLLVYWIPLTSDLFPQVD